MPPKLPTPPATIVDFESYYKRDFKFGDGPDAVMKSDIQRAMNDAMTVFNPGLFSVPDGWKAFLALTAHYVRINIEAAGGLSALGEGLGVENQGEQLLSGAGVSGVNKNYVEPPAIVKRVPIFQQLWMTTYGQQYVTMAAPKLHTVGVVHGPIDAGALGSPSVPFAEY